ncbi:acylphosphatase [Parafilimonas sp.]|uniref:acylphosphatase n=1 Tax=Parafilimonas sp. TaxID=1969739 RepID=UPI0039E3AD2F
MSATAKHITVKGKVQGVFFRKYTKQKATELGLKGWVKNTKEGSVEILAQGDANAVNALIEWCYQGSPKSSVEKVESCNAEADTNLTGFSVHYY